VAYVHGHQVGGTNPSLVEALGAGNPIVAHDNRFNRWVAGEGAAYFRDAASFSALMDELLPAAPRLDSLRQHGMRRFKDRFRWNRVLHEYEDLLMHHLPGTALAGKAAAKGAGPSTTS
jgi:glycosyltransferase involved in cell wall biosynthesis